MYNTGFLLFIRFFFLGCKCGLSAYVLYLRCRIKRRIFKSCVFWTIIAIKEQTNIAKCHCWQTTNEIQFCFCACFFQVNFMCSGVSHLMELPKKTTLLHTHADQYPPFSPCGSSSLLSWRGHKYIYAYIRVLLKSFWAVGGERGEKKRKKEV